MQQASVAEHPIFGGSIAAAFPTRFQDVSNIRQVPDHQEVFVNPSREESLIFELLDLKDDVGDNGSAVWFLHDLANEQDDEGCTTFKWQEYMTWQRKLNEAKASAATLKAGVSVVGSEARHPVSKCKSFFRRSPIEDAEVVIKRNVYDKGFFHNFCEIIFPFSSRASFSQTKLNSS